MEQIVVILLDNPVHIRHRKCLSAVPGRVGHLMFQSGKGQFGAHTQIPGYVGQHPVLQVLPVRLPAHIGAHAVVSVGGRHLAEAGHQDVREGIHQAVTVFVHRAEGDIFPFPSARLHQRVEADLGGGNQAGRLHQHDKFHPREKVLVGLVELQVVDTGAGHNAHVQLLGGAGEHPHPPHLLHVGDRCEAVLTPLLQIVLNAMPAQHHQHLSVAQQGAVHGIGHIGDQVIVEGVVEQNALALQQFQTGHQIIAVQRPAPGHLTLHEQAVRLGNPIRTGLPCMEQLLVGLKVRLHMGGVRPLGLELIPEELAQRLAQQRVVDHVFGLVVLPLHLVLFLFSFEQSVHKEVHLTQDENGEHWVKGNAQQLVAVQHPGDQHGQNGHAHRSIVEEFQIGPCLAQVRPDIPYL